MLLTAARNRRPRRGATIVESALVLSVFLLLLFGMFEYCRFLMVLHVSSNAAREGARYAVVNMDKPADFDYVDFTDSTPPPNTRTYANIQKYTTDRMGGIHLRNIEGFKVACFAVDPAGLAMNPPVVRPKAKFSTTPDPYNNTDPNRVPWNSSVFTEKIAVTVDGNFRPILPTFLLMPGSVSIKTTSVMGSEG